MKSSSRTPKNRPGFSLVEVCLAVSVLAVVILPLCALLPVGLNAHRQSVETMLAAQITQQIVSNLQQTDFTTLTTIGGSCSDGSSGRELIRYFTDAAQPVDAHEAEAIYTTRIRIRIPGGLPGNFAPSADSLARVEIEILHNPTRDPALFDKGGATRQCAYVARAGKK